MPSRYAVARYKLARWLSCLDRERVAMLLAGGLLAAMMAIANLLERICGIGDD